MVKSNICYLKIDQRYVKIEYAIHKEFYEDILDIIFNIISGYWIFKNFVKKFLFTPQRASHLQVPVFHSISTNRLK